MNGREHGHWEEERGGFELQTCTPTLNAYPTWNLRRDRAKIRGFAISRHGDAATSGYKYSLTVRWATLYYLADGNASVADKARGGNSLDLQFNCLFCRSRLDAFWSNAWPSLTAWCFAFLVVALVAFHFVCESLVVLFCCLPSLFNRLKSPSIALFTNHITSLFICF